MKRFQSLLTSFVLVFVLVVGLVASAAASAGTIHTGSPAATMPTPSPESIVLDDGPVDAEGGGGPITLDLFVDTALDCLHAAFTLF